MKGLKMGGLKKAVVASKEEDKAADGDSPKKLTMGGGIKKPMMGGGILGKKPAIGGMKMGGAIGGLGGPKKIIKKDNEEGKAVAGSEADVTAANVSGDEEGKKDGKTSPASSAGGAKAKGKAAGKASAGKKTPAKDADATIDDNGDTPKKKAPAEKKKKKDDKPSMGGSGPGQKGKPVEQKVPFTQEEAETHIAEHMERHNRPYGV